MVERNDLFNKLTEMEKNFLIDYSLTPYQLSLSERGKMILGVSSQSPTIEGYELIRGQFVKKYSEEHLTGNLIDYLFCALGLN